MSLDNIGKRVLELRGKTSRKTFAEQLGVGTATLQRYENNERLPDVGFVKKLQEITGCDFDWLISGKPAHGADSKKDKAINNNDLMQKRESDSARGAGFSPHEGVTIYTNDYAWIPLYNVEVSAGDGRFTDAENVLTYFSMTKYSLRKRGLTDFNQLGFVIVHGDSMFDTLHPNDCIMINFAKTNPDGGIFVLRVGETLYVKRLISEKDCIRVISDNKRYPEWALNADDDFEILGKYEWHGRYAV